MVSTNRIIDAGLRLLREVVRAGSQPRRAPSRSTKHRNAKFREQHRPTGTSSQHPNSSYPGDFTGSPRITYAPFDDDLADPGEIVWTWVPYEEDHTQGKDRPVLVIGRDGQWLLVLQVTSQDHDVDAAQEARAGRYWEDIGTGAWDREGRPSEVRLNRIIRVAPGSVRRIGAVLDEARFRQVADGVTRHMR